MFPTKTQLPVRTTWVADHFIDPWCEWWIDPPRCIHAGRSKRGGRVPPALIPRRMKKEDTTIVDLLEEAIRDPLQQKEAMEARRHEATIRLQTETFRRSIERELNPPETKMPKEVKEYFADKGIEKRVERQNRRAEEEEERKRDIAMRLKMAKVRAAKRKR